MLHFEEAGQGVLADIALEILPRNFFFFPEVCGADREDICSVVEGVGGMISIVESVSCSAVGAIVGGRLSLSDRLLLR